MNIKTEKQYICTCYYCDTDEIHYNRQELTSYLKQKGWHILNKQNCCPDCYKERKENKNYL